MPGHQAFLQFRAARSQSLSGLLQGGAGGSPPRRVGCQLGNGDFRGAGRLFGSGPSPGAANGDEVAGTEDFRETHIGKPDGLA